MKKLIIIVLFTLFVMPTFAKEDLSEIFNNLKEADFEYIHGLDPWQNEDYTKYAWSPYPLLRTVETFYYKKNVIEPGYYLLTPRQREGEDWVLFKSNGRVKFIIPVYKKELVPPGFYEKNIPRTDKIIWQKFCDKTSDTFGKLIKSSKRKLPPNSFIEFEQPSDDFYELILYYDIYKYHMFFMTHE